MIQYGAKYSGDCMTNFIFKNSKLLFCHNQSQYHLLKMIFSLLFAFLFLCLCRTGINYSADALAQGNFVERGYSSSNPDITSFISSQPDADAIPARRTSQRLLSSRTSLRSSDRHFYSSSMQKYGILPILFLFFPAVIWQAAHRRIFPSQNQCGQYYHLLLLYSNPLRAGPRR